MTLKVIIDGVEYVPAQIKHYAVDLTLGQLLKWRRGELGWTLRESADKLQVVPSHVWEMENGRSGISFKMAIKLNDVYGIPLQVLADHCPK